MILDGQAGVRVVRLESELNGNRITDGVVEPVTIDNSNTEVLPAVNLRLEVIDNLFLRVINGWIIVYNFINAAFLLTGVSAVVSIAYTLCRSERLAWRTVPMAVTNLLCVHVIVCLQRSRALL